jgi:hypothetical protein
MTDRIVCWYVSYNVSKGFWCARIAALIWIARTVFWTFNTYILVSKISKGFDEVRALTYTWFIYRHWVADTLTLIHYGCWLACITTVVAIGSLYYLPKALLCAGVTTHIIASASIRTVVADIAWLIQYIQTGTLVRQTNAIGTRWVTLHEVWIGTNAQPIETFVRWYTWTIMSRRNAVEALVAVDTTIFIAETPGLAWVTDLLSVKIVACYIYHRVT